MPTPVPASILEAVNTILAAIAEGPVTTLDTNTYDLPSLAYARLVEASREVQTKGWVFNTETELPLVLSVTDGSVPLPANTIRVKAAPSFVARADAVYRGDLLYDRRNHTYDWRVALGSTATTLNVDIVLLLDWPQLPQVARWYITIKAARRFADGYLASEDIHKFNERDESEALLAMQEHEAKDGDYNILTDNLDVYRTLNRTVGVYWSGLGL